MRRRSGVVAFYSRYIGFIVTHPGYASHRENRGRREIDRDTLLRRMRKWMPPAIVISGEATMAETVEAIRLGVRDFIGKPFSRERLLKSVRNCLDHESLRRQVRVLRAQGQEIIGRSDAIKRCARRSRKSRRPTRACSFAARVAAAKSSSRARFIA